jgi:Ni/Fe-hydrogenase subunit HybB-like protein
MVCFESFLSWRFLDHPPRMDLLPDLARGMSLVLVVYLVFRIEDLAVRGALPAAFVPGMAALLFWLENVLFVIVPVAIVFRTAGRMSTLSLFIASFSAVLGFIMHRFNVAVSGMQLIHPTAYFPTWMELVVSVSLVAGGFIAAGLAVRFLPVHQEAAPESATLYRVKWCEGPRQPEPTEAGKKS